MFIYFLVIRRVRLLHLRSSRFYKGYKNQEVAGRLLEDFEQKKKKGLQGTKWRGYCPFLALGHNTTGGVVTGAAWRAYAHGRDSASTYRVRQVFLGLKSRHQLLCRNKAWLGQACSRS